MVSSVSFRQPFCTIYYFEEENAEGIFYNAQLWYMLGLGECCSLLANALPAFGTEADDPRGFLERPACLGSRKPARGTSCPVIVLGPVAAETLISLSPRSWRGLGWASVASRSLRTARGAGPPSTDHH